MNTRAVIAALSWIAFCTTAAGCHAGKVTRDASVRSLGNTEHGRQLIQSYGCGGCHMIPGIRSARGLVGPPLFYFADRTMIAGELPNTPANLTRWIQHPREVEPKTAMPELGVTQDQANDIAAYLYTLTQRKGLSWND